MRIIAAVAAVAWCAGIPARADAQVGYAPGDSPYRDARFRQMFTGSVTYFDGGRGEAGVGPTDGLLGGLRWDISVGGAGSLLLGAAGGSASRTIVNPGEAPERQTVGTVNQTFVLLDAGFNFILTGRKSWRGVAPYLGATLGMAVGSRVPEDSLGFTFRNKFQVGPLLGFRYFLADRIHLRVEGRDVLWRLNYPDAFFQSPANAPPGTPPILDPRVNRRAQWVHHPTLSVGLGWTFRQ